MIISLLLKTITQPLQTLSRVWNRVWNVSAKRLPVKTLETVVLILTLAIVFMAFWFAQLIALWVLVFGMGL